MNSKLNRRPFRGPPFLIVILQSTAKHDKGGHSMPEVSLLISARDNFSGNVIKMRDANKRFSKDLDGLNAQLEKLNRTKYDIKLEADKAKKS